MKLIKTLAKQELVTLVKKHETLSSILRELGYEHFGCSLKTLKSHAAILKVDLTKFATRENFQSHKVAARIRNDKAYQVFLDKWKSGLDTGHQATKSLRVSLHIRKYFFEKHESKCSICGWGEKNPVTNKVPLQLHHKDGDARNCQENNLQLLCPNCHSLTATFGRLNKVTFRKHR